jgi:hypothetical protein
VNTTDRAANRLFLLVLGLLLVAAGAASVLLAALPAFSAGWKQRAADIPTSAPAWITAAAVGTVSWLAVGIGVIAVVLAVLLIVFVLRQGRGHTASVLEDRNGSTGRTRIDLAVPRHLLDERLGQNPDVLASRITAYDVRGTPTLKVSVRARRGASPAAITDDVLTALHALDAVLGEELPTCLQISGGFRARSAGRARVA